MYGKLVTLSVLLAAVACHDLTTGLTSGGRKIYDEKVIASPALWKQVQSISVNATKDEVIARIVIKDNRPNKDGSVNITEGGVGHNNVTIELKSPTIFRGMDFNVLVYSVAKNEYVKRKHDIQVPTGIDTKVDVNSTSKRNTTKDAKHVTSPSARPQTFENNEAQINIPAASGKDSTKKDNKTNVQGNKNNDPDSAVASIFPLNSTEADSLPLNPSVVVQDQNDLKILPTTDIPRTTKVNDLSTTTDKASSNEQITSIAQNDRTITETTASNGQVSQLLTQNVSPIPYNRKY